MENATKALLIAGSVLIAILLIAMGLRIFNSTSSTTESAQKTMDTTTIATFNGQFTGYLNKKITASQCATLIQKLIASNATNPNKEVKFNSNLPQIATPTEGTYEAEYNDGYIVNIKIKL